jgi:putative membrane protein
MKHLLAAASCVAAAFAVAPAWAQQQGDPAGATPGTQSRSGLPASNQPNVADRNFARAAAAGGLSEVELGRLADHKGQSSEARQFAQRMVDDHSKANDQLKELAAAANIPLPNEPGPEDQAMRVRLDKMQGDAAFDRDYIRCQISAHQQTVQLFEYEIGSGQDSQLKNFASQTLPVLMRHLEMAQNINARLTGAAER